MAVETPEGGQEKKAEAKASGGQVWAEIISLMCCGLSRHAFEALLFALQSSESRARVQTHAQNSPDVVVCYLPLLIFLV